LFIRFTEEALPNRDVLGVPALEVFGVWGLWKIEKDRFQSQEQARTQP